MSYSTSGILGGLSNITFGSGDAENFSYNPSTGRITGFQMVVNGAADTGTLTWNSNGTLGQMAISDGISGSTDSETCNYGYDDLARQSSVNCGTGWAQNFSYDAFGNIAKTVPSGSTGSAFSPTYSSATNQFTSIPGVTPGYDLDGRLLTDNVNTYTWDPWGDLATVNGSSAETYDAFGHLVETNFGELVYGPSGKWLAIASGSTLLRAFMPLAAGSRAVYGSSGLLEYMTADWEGSDRLASTPSRTASTTEYAPFGETYGSSGDDSYTGQLQTTVTSLLDFPARRYSPSQGRWISPDPLGVGAVTQTNPQSWNRYAYVLNNPAAFIDPMGLEEDVCDDESTVCFDGFSGDGGDDGGGGAPPDCNAPDTACVNGNPPSCDPSDTTCQVQNPGISQPIPGSPTNPQTPINVPSLINNAKGLLSQRCKSKFGQKIPGYTTSRFFNTLSNATINQYPFATPPQDSSSYGADAVTHPPGGPIDLLPNFYGRDPTSQAFVLIHEGIHLFGRGNLGDSAVQNLFGLPVTGNTENITQYIAAGCYP
jgi:RHS repeat-associated protein